MSSEEKLLEGGPEESSHETPQAITITIMDPSALETTSLDNALVTSVQAQDEGSGMSTLLVVPQGDMKDGATKDLLQTVTETHMGTQDLPVISSITNDDTTPVQNTIQVVAKTHEENLAHDSLEGHEEEEEEDLEELMGQHCLVCNIEMTPPQDEMPVAVFKSQTTTTQRKTSVFLGLLVGQKLTSRKAHSDILCRRCFNLLDRVDALEVEIKDTKEEIITKYQETVTAYGGRARRRKPAIAKKSDYVFPKVEPDDDLLGLEVDDNFEPNMEDLMDEEHDRREDRTNQDEEWEPDFKRPKIKKEPLDLDPSAPPKRKRGRPRKDASKPKAEVWLRQGGGVAGEGAEDGDTSTVPGRPVCSLCGTSFSFQSQLRRHIRYEHPDVEPQQILGPSGHHADPLMEMEEETIEDDNTPVPINLSCIWCEQDFTEKDTYDEHLDEHSNRAYQQYLKVLLESCGGSESVVTKIEREDVVENGEGVTQGEGTEGNANRLYAVGYRTKQSQSTGPIIKDEITAKSGDSTEKESKEYKCRYCDLTSLVKVGIERHMDKCHDGLPRTCALCQEECMNTTNFKSHIVHHFNGVIVCPVCPIRFTIRGHLLSHLEHYHGSGYVIECSECNVSFSDYEKFESHEAREHGRGGVRTCEVCEVEVLSYDFPKHMNNHEMSALASGECQPHTCNLCRRSFMFTTQLYHHKYKDHPESFSFKCDECERKFRTEWMLLSHKWGHRYGSHQCPACKLKFRQVDQLKRHLIGAHPEVEGFCCKFCPIQLKNYSTYVQHLKFKHPREAGYDKRPVRCKLCGESFAHKVQWKYHMRNHSQELQTCEVCGISVKNLEIHMNLHTKEKKYECRHCGAIYHNKASFHFHVKRVHMGEEVRKHICNTCNKGFLTPADLRIHLARVHHGERNYWCKICNKGYKSKVSLTYHQRLHTGERPHQCTICNRAFRVPSYLKRHMEHDHRAQYPGVYFKQGRPKSQELRGQARRRNALHYHPQEDMETGELVEVEEGSIPEVVQITVPMEMGQEVISAVRTVQDLESDEHCDIEQDGVVYVVYEN